MKTLLTIASSISILRKHPATTVMPATAPFTPPSEPKPKPAPKAKPTAKAKAALHVGKGAAPRRRRGKVPPGRVERWRERASAVWRGVNAVPPAVLTVILLMTLAVGFVGANLLHWVIRKPTELLAPVSGAFVKAPAATWEEYGPLFRRYSTAIVAPELLAALAQVESAGNPAAHTYWRWNPKAPDLFGIYRPASSSVGMYQMTDPAYADARRWRIRDHAVVRAPKDGGEESLYSRIAPERAIELTSALLDRTVAGILGPKLAQVSMQRKADVATITHLCGPGPARAFVRRGFRLAPGERCGDEDPAAYLAQVVALERQFHRLSAR